MYGRRLILMGVLATLLVPPGGAHHPSQEPDVILLVSGPGEGLISWSPVPGASIYDVYRLVDEVEMTWERVGRTARTVLEIPPEDLEPHAYYTVTSGGHPSEPRVQAAGPGEGCVSMSSKLQIRVTMKNCLS